MRNAVPRVPRSLGLRRSYSMRSPLSFIPNESRHRFDSENLTEEENIAAIPKRPNLNDIQKIHHEIWEPRYVCDLLAKPNVNDVFISTLSQDAVFSGDPTYKVTPKSNSSEPEALKLHFADVVTKWIDVFNQQIIKLKELPEKDISLNNISEHKAQIINTKLKSFDNDELKSMEGLQNFYSSFGVFESRDPIESASSKTINIENISFVLLTTSLFQKNSESFDTLLRYLESRLSYFSNRGLQAFTEQLIDNLHDSNIASGMKLQSFNKFMLNVLELHPRLSLDLHVVQLDRLAYLFTLAANTAQARDLLVLLVTRYKTAPAPDTFSLFLNKYADSLQEAGSERTKILRDLYNLKPVFFHTGLSNFSLEFLLSNIVEHVYDLDNLIRLVETVNKPNKFLLGEHAHQLIAQLGKIQSTSSDSDLIKSLQLTQLLRKLVIDNGLRLSAEAKSNALKIYEDLNQHIDISYLN